MSMLAFKGGRAGLRTGPVTFLWWSSNTNDSAFLHSHEHSTPVPWYRALCFSASSQWGHSGVSKQGHLGVSLLKAIAWLFISGFVQKGSHTRYLVHSRLWYLEEVRLLYGVAFLLSPPAPNPLQKFYSLWEVSLKLSRIYSILMPLRRWECRDRRRQRERQIHDKEDM